MRNVSTIQLLLSKYLMWSSRLSARCPLTFLSCSAARDSSLSFAGNVQPKSECVFVFVSAAQGHASLDSAHKWLYMRRYVTYVCVYACVLCPVSSSAPGFYHSQLSRWPHTTRAGFQQPAEPALFSKSLSFFSLSVYRRPCACNSIRPPLYLFIPTSVYISYSVCIFDAIVLSAESARSTFFWNLLIFFFSYLRL